MYMHTYTLSNFMTPKVDYETVDMQYSALLELYKLTSEIQCLCVSDAVCHSVSQLDYLSIISPF